MPHPREHQPQLVSVWLLWLAIFSSPQWIDLSVLCAMFLPRLITFASRNRRLRARGGATTLFFLLFFLFLLTLSLSSFWTSRGHRCRRFFPPVLVFNFYRA